MTILKSDIKLVASQVMTDVTNGGGAPTATIIPDGASNAIFPDISELDRAGGRVSMRKVFAHIQSNNVDGYMGANFIVATPPADPNVAVTIFSLGEIFDRRSNAASRVESYLNGQGEYPAFLYENHIEGQRAIQLFARTTVEPPPIGRTILLRKREGFSDQYEQYVRITRVSVEERTFTYNTDTDYKANIITCDISDALRADFPGTPANRQFVRDTSKTIIRDTVVADAGSYCSAQPLVSPITLGDAAAQVASIYTQLVPNARTETAVADQRPSSAFEIALASTPRAVSVGGAPLSQRFRVGQENRSFNWTTIVKPLPAPGSVRVTYRALGVNYSIVDDGAGNLTGSGSGTINYLTGSIVATLNALPDDRSAVIFYWGPNVAYTNRSGSAGYRAPDLVFDLEHQGVTPGSFSISWESGGVVKTATDDGSGSITGDATGRITYTTGAVHLSPSAMIDAAGEFSISYTWSTVVEELKTGLTPDGAGIIAFTFDQTPVAGTVEVQWATSKVATLTSGVTESNGSTNKASGSQTTAAMVDTSKTYRYFTDAVASAWAAPKEETTVQEIQVPTGTVAYAPGTGTPYAPTHPEYTVTTKQPVIATTAFSGSDSSMYSKVSSQTSKTQVTTSHLITDNGSGAFFGAMGTISYGSKTASLKVIGDYSSTSYSANYEDASTFESLNDTSEPTGTAGGGTPPTTSQGGGGSTSAKGGDYGTSEQTEVYGANSLFVRYKTGSPTPTAHTESYVPPGVSIDLCPYTTDPVVPNSVRFTWMGTVYEDFEGLIYRGRTDSNPGILSGALNYTSGIAAMSDYVVSGSASNFTLQSLWTRKPRERIANVVFSTSLAPVKPSGITISVLDVDGNQIIATANTSGDITGTHCHGKIDYASGLVECQFGDYVLASGLTAKERAEPWYDADNIRTSDGKIWRPWHVDPETLRYTAVAYFYLPLDADILGLDPVRLPQDGRVPIFRSGGFVVIGNTQSTTPAAVSNGTVVDCGRVRLSRVRVIGANGLTINAGYTEDLEAGTVTFTDVTGYSQPVHVEHRIEDMVMVAEVQISGHLSFTRQVTHDYPVDGTYVSSALVAGDMQTYVELSFDQVTFTGWSDAQSGSAATGTYNEIANPIELSNIGTVTERWAIVVNSGGTTFNVQGEHVGVIAQGNFTTDCAPINPATGEPYFTLRAAGWGSGWAAGNVFRFNTIGSIYPIWCVRTIQQGPASGASDQCTLLIRGDIDTP